MSDVTFDMPNNKMEVHQRNAEPWRVTLVDTGDNTMTGGRLKRVFDYVKDEKEFCFTYGDGPPGRVGVLDMDGNAVNSFGEKPKGDGGWINGGYFVLSPSCIDLVEDDSISWEKQPLGDLAARGELMAYEHNGFFQPMDTLRDKNQLEELWSDGKAPWKVWK